MSIIGIIAISENFAIGKDGKLPWHYPADLKFFKRMTTGSAVVMGLHTWKSIGKALPKRLNIVVSRSSVIGKHPGVILIRSKEEVVSLSKYLNSDLYIMGGAKTYTSFSPNIDRWIVTRIPVSVEDADVFMPRDFLESFNLEETRVSDGGLRIEMYKK